MDFKTGQKVVCVNDHFRSYCPYPVKKGLTYTIDGFFLCPCGSRQVTLKEKPFSLEMRCGCGRISYRRQSYYSWRFIPIDLLTNFLHLTDKKLFPAEIQKENSELKKELAVNSFQV